MSWDCKDCGDGHPGRFAFCPVSGRPRTEADVCETRTLPLMKGANPARVAEHLLSTGQVKTLDAALSIAIDLCLGIRVEGDR